jgi:hypothetical protein
MESHMKTGEYHEFAIEATLVSRDCTVSHSSYLILYYSVESKLR